MSVHDIPALNATLNGVATVLMTVGFSFIWRAKRERDLDRRAAHVRSHRLFMLSAGAVSGVFLIAYVTHKVLVRGVHTPFGGQGGIRAVYYVMLLTHVVLAMAIAFLVPRTFALALRGEIERHRAWARWTFPIWYYVSITGVLVYFFLYRWWPATR